ncbi:MAG: endonuclease/exonuclease/phosphatase family protein [Candidatus Nanohalobium sp.]
MKILEFNANYFLGFNGKLTDYVLKSRRAVRSNREVEFSTIEQFVDLLEEEEPDVVYIAEVDGGSFRTTTQGHMEEIVERCSERGIDYSSRFHSKYGERKKLSQLPVLKHMGNGLLYKDGFESEIHYVTPGVKELVYEVKDAEEDFSFFTVHLPLVRHTRRKQIKKLQQMIEEKVSDGRKALISGDFNNYYGERELRPFTERDDFNVVSPGDTLYNTFLPYREVDLFIHSEEVNVSDCRTVDLKISDHLPTVVEIDFS